MPPSVELQVGHLAVPTWELQTNSWSRVHLDMDPRVLPLSDNLVSPLPLPWLALVTQGLQKLSEALVHYTQLSDPL